MKILADECVSRAAVRRALRSGSHDVHWVSEDTALMRHKDAAIFSRAVREGWLLVTNDFGFCPPYHPCYAGTPGVLVAVPPGPADRDITERTLPWLLFAAQLGQEFFRDSIIVAGRGVVQRLRETDAVPMALAVGSELGSAPTRPEPRR